MHITNFINFVENQFETKVKVIKSDNGDEFEMDEFFNSKGIIHQKGIVERKHQHLLNVTRALIFQSKLSTRLWSNALMHVAFLINITPTPFLENCTPHEKLYGKSYNFKDPRVFGCLCYIKPYMLNVQNFSLALDLEYFLGFLNIQKFI